VFLRKKRIVGTAQFSGQPSPQLRLCSQLLRDSRCSQYSVRGRRAAASIFIWNTTTAPVHKYKATSAKYKIRRRRDNLLSFLPTVAHRAHLIRRWLIACPIWLICFGTLRCVSALNQVRCHSLLCGCRKRTRDTPRNFCPALCSPHLAFVARINPSASSKEPRVKHTPQHSGEQ
jgi:hypothetical protein